MASNSEYMKLQSVLICWPPDSIAEVKSPQEMLFLQKVDLGKMRRQCQALVECYSSNGVNVHLLKPRVECGSPNLIFIRDTFAMTEWGFLRGNMGVAQRKLEGPLVGEYLSALSIDPFCMIPENITFEGADWLWLNSKTVLLGVGKRTSLELVAYMRGKLESRGIQIESVAVGGNSQHLLGVMQIVDSNKVIVRKERSSKDLESVLRKYGFDILFVDLGSRMEDGWIANSVTIAPNKIIVPAGNSEYLCYLKKIGVEAIPVEVGEYVHAAGGVGCATGIIDRKLVES